MAAQNSLNKSAFFAGKGSSTHLFAIGQAVRMTGGYTTLASRIGQVYHVTGRLPPVGNSLQYRIRSEAEQYDRVTTEDCLEPIHVDDASGRETLADRTFRT